MPELPDVEATRRYLQSSGLAGRSVRNVELFWSRAVKEPGLEDFVLTLCGQRIEDVGRRAKFLLFPLEQGWTLVMHLRMTGSLLVEDADEPRPAMTRNLYVLDDGRELRFVDPRKLGQIWLVEDTDSLLGRLGPEPLGPGFTVDVLQSCLAKRSAPIKALLCDQAVIAGIGNIYADELLFASGIHPLLPGSGLSSQQVERLHAEIEPMLTAATDTLTASMPFHGPPTESAEGLQRLKVPRGRNGVCSRCGGEITRVPVRGRSTYYCQACQE
jgi:formamidopyrimidine-DNA glycosylase